MHCKHAAMEISSMQVCDGDETAAAVSLAHVVTPVVIMAAVPLPEIATTFAKSKEDRRVSTFCTILYSLLLWCILLMLSPRIYSSKKLSQSSQATTRD